MLGNPMSADTDEMIDIESVSRSDHKMAKTLRVVIFLMQLILAFSVLLLVIASAVLGFSDALQEQLYGSFDVEMQPNKMMFPLVCLGGAVIAAAWFWVLYMLRLIVGTLIAGDPFVPGNINRLRRMWIVIAAAELFRMVIVAFASTSFTNGENGLQIRLGVWFLVFVIATLSEAFRYGAAMRQEQELTI